MSKHIEYQFGMYINDCVYTRGHSNMHMNCKFICIYFDPIVCICLLLMYCFNCHNSMSFCIFKLSLYIFIVVIIVGLTTVISFVKLNI